MEQKSFNSFVCVIQQKTDVLFAISPLKASFLSVSSIDQGEERHHFQGPPRPGPNSAESEERQRVFFVG